MKTIYKLLLFSLLALAGCSRADVELTFGETPEQRMNASHAEFKQKLIESEFGWEVIGETKLKGNFGYYMDFDANGHKDRVRMVADINNNSMDEVQTSSYRVRLISAPMLSFETYSYIHLLNDPNPGIMGGNLGQGLQADFEFNLNRISADSIFLTGRRYRNEMVMVKATKAKQDKYLNKGYSKAIQEVKNTLSTNKNSFFDFNNTTYQINVNNLTRQVKLISVVGSKIESQDDIFSYSIDGIELANGFSLGLEKIIKVLFENDKLYALTSSGNKVEIRGEQEAILPLNKLIGHAYKKLHLPHLTQYAGTNVQGNSTLQELSNFVRQVPDSYDKGEINLIWDTENKFIILEALVSKGIYIYPTRVRYSYVHDEQTGLYKLSNMTTLDMGYVLYRIMSLTNFLSTQEFKLDFFVIDGTSYGRIVNKNGSIAMSLMPL